MRSGIRTHFTAVRENHVYFQQSPMWTKSRLLTLSLTLLALGFVAVQRFRGAPQLAPSNLNGPSAVSETGPDARIAWFSGLNRLSDDRREDDFPSIAAAPNGTIWAVWSSYSGLYDEIR